MFVIAANCVENTGQSAKRWEKPRLGFYRPCPQKSRDEWSAWKWSQCIIDTHTLLKHLPLKQCFVCLEFEQINIHQLMQVWNHHFVFLPVKEGHANSRVQTWSVLRSMSKPFKHPSFNIHTEKKHFRSSSLTFSLKINIKETKKQHKNTVDVKNYDHS